MVLHRSFPFSVSVRKHNNTPEDGMEGETRPTQVIHRFEISKVAIRSPILDAIHARSMYRYESHLLFSGILLLVYSGHGSFLTRSAAGRARGSRVHDGARVSRPGSRAPWRVLWAFKGRDNLASNRGETYRPS